MRKKPHPLLLPLQAVVQWKMRAVVKWLLRSVNDGDGDDESRAEGSEVDSLPRFVHIAPKPPRRHIARFQNGFSLK